MSQPYKIILDFNSVELRIKNSRFIASVYPVNTKEEAVIELNKIRKKYWDANHNCYAYRLSPNGLESKMSDDGEPSGTAGKPILYVLQQQEIVNVLVVVTRYFGGIKLGVGGLVRAYTDATKEVLAKSKIVEVFETENYRVFAHYDDISLVRPIIEKYSVSFNEEFHDVVRYNVVVKQELSLEFTEKIVDISKGRAGWSKL